MKARITISFLLCFLPWRLRRAILNNFFGFNISPTAKIGLSIILCKSLKMDEKTKIGNLNFIKGLDEVVLEKNSSIGNLNWITGFPSNVDRHFSQVENRKPALLIGEHSAITNRHLIDCTDQVSIGSFSTFAGFRSQILTHSIDLKSCRQSSKPVKIGNYCFVGTGCIILGGAELPDRSVLGAGSLLSKKISDQSSVYAGVPARKVKEISDEHEYFKRKIGFVD